MGSSTVAAEAMTPTKPRQFARSPPSIFNNNNERDICINDCRGQRLAHSLNPSAISSSEHSFIAFWGMEGDSEREQTCQPLHVVHPFFCVPLFNFAWRLLSLLKNKNQINCIKFYGNERRRKKSKPKELIVGKNVEQVIDGRCMATNTRKRVVKTSKGYV